MNSVFWTRRVLPFVLISPGIGGLLLVFWVFPYIVRERDDEWLTNHSSLALWEHTQNRIHRVGWMHDDFGIVGRHGDEIWAGWIMERLLQENDPGGCGGGHKLSALESITNFSPVKVPVPGKDVRPLWLDWWKRNSSRTQKDWIVDGFAAEGVIIHNPPVKADWPALLKVLGHKNPGDLSCQLVFVAPQPAHFYYNAYRCLRDTGFDPVGYALEEKVTPEIKDGLLAYQKQAENERRAENRPRGPFETQSRGGKGAVPRVLEQDFRQGWGLASIVACVAGLWLWIWPREQKLSAPVPAGCENAHEEA